MYIYIKLYIYINLIYIWPQVIVGILFRLTGFNFHAVFMFILYILYKNIYKLYIYALYKTLYSTCM